jgi:hypothetical protein
MSGGSNQPDLIFSLNNIVSTIFFLKSTSFNLVLFLVDQVVARLDFLSGQAGQLLILFFLQLQVLSWLVFKF